MAGWRQVVELAMTKEEVARLAAVSRSRTEPASRVERAQMLLASTGRTHLFCVAARRGSEAITRRSSAASNERWPMVPWWRSTTDRDLAKLFPTITPEAKAWLVYPLASDKAKEHGYPHELWTTRAFWHRHARQHGPAAGHRCPARLVQLVHRL